MSNHNDKRIYPQFNKLDLEKQQKVDSDDDDDVDYNYSKDSLNMVKGSRRKSSFLDRSKSFQIIKEKTSKNIFQLQNIFQYRKVSEDDIIREIYDKTVRESKFIEILYTYINIYILFICLILIYISIITSSINKTKKRFKIFI